MKRSDLTAAFETFDRGNKGFVDLSDLRTLRDQLGDEMSDEDVRLMFEWADNDCDGLLKQQEFITALITQPGSEDAGVAVSEDTVESPTATSEAPETEQL